MMVNHTSPWSNFFVNEYRVPEYKGPCFSYEDWEKDEKDDEEVVIVSDDDKEVDNDSGESLENESTDT